MPNWLVTIYDRQTSKGTQNGIIRTMNIYGRWPNKTHFFLFLCEWTLRNDANQGHLDVYVVCDSSN